LAQVRAGINRPQSHDLHVACHRLVVDPQSIHPQLSGDLTNTIERTGRINLVDAPLEMQLALVQRAWDIVHA
jgi:hypothetical protein